MGSSQSSPINAKGSSKRSNAVGGRGRKSTNHKKPSSAPHGLASSVVSLPSELLNQVCGNVTEEPTSSHDHSFDIEEDIGSESEAGTWLLSKDLLDLTPTVTPKDEDDSWEQERQLVLNDARQLKQLAVFFLHPEVPVSSQGHPRCFFDRASAPEPDTFDQAEEKAAVLRDAAALKQAAFDCLHPEAPVQTTDPCAFGRNFFCRYSAAGQASSNDEEERAAVVADAKILHKLAVDYKHPELPVSTDPSCFARCYFDRASAPEQLSADEAKEMALIFEDVAALKKTAMDFLHPEIPVKNTNAKARCYFERASAPDQLTAEEAEEKALIMADAIELKKAAIDYLHPEVPVKTSDPYATSRCYFDRASAPERLTPEEVEERDAILEDLKALSEAAADFLHPERPIATSPTATARCFFSRFSAMEQESKEEADEREEVLSDALALRVLALDYLHPERSVVTDPIVKSRCFFDRPSAPDVNSEDYEEERRQVLAEAKALESLAGDFLHPEKPVNTTCPFSSGRNFFDRPSARYHDRMIHTFPPHEHDEIDHQHEHTDHFGMEEFYMADISPSKIAGGNIDFSTVDFSKVADEVEGNLSRSPSSVMLYGQEEY